MKAAGAYLSVLLCVGVLVSASEGLEDGPVVKTVDGPVKGKILSSFKGRDFYAFQSIPYAKPPLGELRFKAPKPPTPWKDTLDATKDAPVCIQIELLTKFVGGQEDCLYLNVYTPELPKSGENPNYDVMVWIHGGAYFSGMGNRNFYGPDLLLDEDIVLVTINYRVGLLGFLSTADQEASGNWGMKDQVQALKWVQKNIAQFGGNPNSVTIFGESAGGASVQLHMLSPMSSGLFHKAISQSGSALGYWSLGSNPRYFSKWRGKELGCVWETSTELVECLRKADLSKAKVTDVASPDGLIMMWNPVVEWQVDEDDEAFLPDKPRNLLTQGRVADVPWMTGVTSHEGLLFSKVAVDGNLTKLLHQMLKQLAFDHKGNSEGLLAAVKTIYSKDGADLTPLEIVDFFTDISFEMDAQVSAQMQSQVASSPVYFYHFTYQGRYSLTQLDGSSGVEGVCHFDDVMYLFDCPAVYPKLKPEDPEVKIAERMVKMWTNFAKTGNPTPNESDILPVTWKPVTSTNFEDLEYLEIGDNLEMKQGLHPDRIKFWINLLGQRKKDEL